MRKHIGLPRSAVFLSIYSLIVFAQKGADPSGILAYRHAGEIWIQRVPDGVPIQMSQGGGEYPKWSFSGQWLSFRRNEHFVVVPINGNRQDAVTVDAAGVWSPVKDQLAFADADGLTVLSFEGNFQQKRVLLRSTKPGSIGDITWSYDGTRLAFLANGSLWRINADGTDAKALFSPAQHDGTLIRGWSSDGKHVIVSIDPDHSASLASDGLPLAFAPVEGGRAHTFGSNVLLHADFLSVSPDHAEVLVSAGGGREAWKEKRVTSVDPATGKFTFLSSAKDAAVSPSWSPDGNRIAYVSAEDADAGGGEAARVALGKRRIWIMNADGSQKRQLTSDSHYRDEYPQWSRDGRFIVFARMDEQDKASIWVVKIGNAELRKVVDEFDDDNPINDILRRTLPNARPASAWFGYYGYIEWSRSIAWHPE